MDKEVKKRWVKALRSGEYKQGRNFLCAWDSEDQEYRMCCLGVLADIAFEGEWIMDTCVESATYVFESDKNEYITGHTELSEDALKKLGITDDDQEKLIKMNDDIGLSFHVIAAYIEENL